MAFGDVGGAVTELVITCETPSDGVVDIKKGDALRLTGPYTVSNRLVPGDRVFGQALAHVNQNGMGLPVKVRGICIFTYTGEPPAVDGIEGVIGSDAPGTVMKPETWYGQGTNLQVDTEAKEVHVLL